MTDYARTSIFAQSAMGGLYMGIQDAYDDEPVLCYDPQCSCGEEGADPPTPVYYRLPDDIGEAELLRELRCAQETGEIPDKYKVHNRYHTGGRNFLSPLMKRDENGVQYHPGRGLIKVRERWAKEAGIKNVIPEAELDALEDK